VDSLLIIGNAAENPFVEDVCHHIGQDVNYSDLVSLKSFLNGEFCPRFIGDEEDLNRIGNQLKGKKVCILSTTRADLSRNELAMRTFLIARAAKENGAEKVILFEPDLFYSAQDRGPRREHGYDGEARSLEDLKKFDGQAFSSRLYAELLKQAGVDQVLTVHNHSASVERLFTETFSGAFRNLIPSTLYGNFIKDSDIVDHENLVVCAPDGGAMDFARKVALAVPDAAVPVLQMCKHRTGEREVEIAVAENSEVSLDSIDGKDVVVVDDMVRTGKTIVECCRVLRTARPRRVVFLVTHFYSAQEGRFNMSDPAIDEIVTTSTIPGILNRDEQGRLRRKLVVLRLERWIAHSIRQTLRTDTPPLDRPFYAVDMSSKNPRWKGLQGPRFSDY